MHWSFLQQCGQKEAHATTHACRIPICQRSISRMLMITPTLARQMQTREFLQHHKEARRHITKDAGSRPPLPSKLAMHTRLSTEVQPNRTVIHCPNSASWNPGQSRDLDCINDRCAYNQPPHPASRLIQPSSFETKRQSTKQGNFQTQQWMPHQRPLPYIEYIH